MFIDEGEGSRVDCRQLNAMCGHGIVVVSGFIATGSSALIDALRGSDEFVAILPEFKILAGPYGLYQVMHSFTRGRREGMMALRWYGTRLIEEGKSPTRLYWRRRQLMQMLVPRSDAITHRRRSYEQSIPRYRHVTLRYLKDLKRSLSGARDEDVDSLTEAATSHYFQKLSEQVLRGKSARYVIFNQTIKPGKQTGKGLSLIEDARVIVVDRDPRDQYLDLMDQGRLRSVIERYGTPTGNLPADFARWYRGRREPFYGKSTGHPRLLVVRFEDLCSVPDEVLFRVGKFIGLGQNSTFNRRLFRQEEAIKKVGRWRLHPDQRAIRIIETELPEYCHS